VSDGIGSQTAHVWIHEGGDRDDIGADRSWPARETGCVVSELDESAKIFRAMLELEIGIVPIANIRHGTSRKSGTGVERAMLDATGWLCLLLLRLRDHVPCRGITIAICPAAMASGSIGHASGSGSFACMQTHTCLGPAASAGDRGAYDGVSLDALFVAAGCPAAAYAGVPPPPKNEPMRLNKPPDSPVG
jgi:hypothetical protein